MSAKRRRSINIDTAIIEALKSEADCKGVGSHTAMALKILLGECDGLGDIQLYGKTSGVSMRESFWLALRARGDSLGISSTAAARLILIGGQPPLSKSELEIGEELANEREKSRSNTPEPKRGVRKYKKNISNKDTIHPQKNDQKQDVESSHSPLFEEDKCEEMQRRKRQSALPKGSPIEIEKAHPKSALKKLDPEDEEYLGGVYSL